MKLKKIASLALAGMMAVSMLAGCSTAAVDPTPNPNPAPSTSNVVSAFENAAEAYTDATISVKESTKLNAYIDEMADKFTYEQLKANVDKVVGGFESIFGVENMTDMMKTAPTNKAGTQWYYAIVDAGSVSDTTALIKSANMIGEQLSGLKDAFLVEGGTNVTVTKPSRPYYGYRPNGNVNVDVDVTADVTYNVTYTMYVHQVNVTKVNNTDVPVTVAVLKVEATQKV